MASGTMRWRGTEGSFGLISQGFPAIAGLRAEDVRNGNVRVVATSPSGRSQLLDVMEVDGMYNTNFTPDEVGDWSVSVRYNDEHVDGSPFHVRVYDPGRVTVRGLDSGLSGRNYTFNVAVAGAGEGALAIDVMHNSRMLPAQISPAQHGEYNVTFVPQGSGYYTIKIYFAEVEVAGSPYTVEIIDPGSASAFGPGLSEAQVQSPAYFTINTGQHSGATANDCRVSITDPRGALVMSNVMDHNNGNLRVEFVPRIVGDHRIDITYHGRPIAGSTFICKVSDRNVITVSNLPRMGRIGKPVEFDINALQAGEGDLEIIINGGALPCTVQARGTKQFHAAFTPQTSQTCEIQIKFNGHDVAGSPWTVEIASVAYLSVTGAGLNLVPVNEPAWFEVRGLNGSQNRDLAVNITSPSHRTVRTNITTVQNGTHRVEYTPTEAGNYSIDVQCDGETVPNSPFTSKAYDISAITCTSLPLAFIDKPAEFTVDASRAGEGDLEISVNRGTVPFIGRPISKGVIAVSFVPKEAKIHNIDIKFNRLPVRGCCMSVPVIDNSQIVVKCHSRTVPVHRLVSVRINTQSAGDAELEVDISSPNGASVPSRIMGSSSRGFDVEFTPTESGVYRLEMKYGGQNIHGCPLHITAYDINRIKVFELHDGIMNLENSFRVETSGAGEGSLSVSVASPSGTPVTNYVRPISTGLLGVFFTPVQSGVHLVTAIFNNEVIPGSPFRINILDPSKASARGDGLDIVPCGQLASFFMTAPSAQMKDFDVKIIAPNARDVPRRITDVGTSHFKVEYTPNVPGDYHIEITYYGQPIPMSPFIAKAWDINKVIVNNITAGRVGNQSSFNISVKDAGEGTLEIGISGPSGQNVGNSVTALGPGVFVISYVPQESGPHRANVTFNGESVNGNPFTFNVNDPSRVVARGEGLGLVKCDQATGFFITAQGAQIKDIDVKITAPNNRDIIPRLTEAGANNFKALYTPVIAGDYVIEISCFDQQITGSPFTAHASDISKVLVSNIPAGAVGQQSAFSIDVKNAGDCTLEISICGPSGQNVSNNVVAQSPGLFLVSFAPVESGQHRATVTFNKENVRGSPFAFMVIDPQKVAAKGDGLGLVRCNTQASFVVTAPAAQQTDLEVTITGPNNKQVASRVTESLANNFKIDYTPVNSGDHQIEVVYFNQPIAGSPFIAKVWDPTKVIVSPMSSGNVGIASLFTIEVKEAGEGTLEISIFGPSGQNIPNNVVSLGPSQFEVSYVPTESGLHRAKITFNKENVLASPFQFMVIDSNRVSVRGDGLTLVKVNQLATFFVTAPAAQLKDIDICITGPASKAIIPSIGEQGLHTFKVDYTPPVAGDYKIDVLYFGQIIPSSPFNVKARDTTKVVVSQITTSHVGTHTTFNIDARDAGDGTLEVSITSPSNRNVQNVLSQLGHGRYEVMFIPTEVGQHLTNVTFNKENVASGRFQFLVTDPGNAGVRGDGLGLVRCNQPATLTVIAPGAQITNVGLHVTEQIIRYTETVVWVEGGKGSWPLVDLNKQCPGNIFTGGLPQSYCWQSFSENRKTSPAKCLFPLPAPSITNADPPMYGTYGPDNKEIPARLAETSNTGYFTGEYLPTVVGQYVIAASYFGHPVSGSPFTASAWNASLINISGPRSGCIGKMLTLSVVAYRAGEGSLDVEITASNEMVPYTTKSLGNGNYEVLFTPHRSDPHLVALKFNGEMIPGSPFNVTVIDGGRVTAAGEGLGKGIIANKLTSFSINSKMVSGEAQLSVSITSPRGQQLMPKVIGSQSAGYNVEYTPLEAGRYVVDIKYAEMTIAGSPFYPEVYDPFQVRITRLPVGFTGKPLTFEVNTAMAGEGHLAVDVRGHITHPLAEVFHKSPGLHTVSFVPQESVEHNVIITFNGVPVPGSPFCCSVVDMSGLSAKWDSVRVRPVHIPVVVELDTKQTPEAEVSCLVTDPQGVNLVSKISRAGRVYKAEFTGHSVGEHRVELRYGGVLVPGSPFTCNLYDTTKVRIGEVTPCANVGQPTSFTVDLTGAGLGADLDVHVAYNDVRIPTQVQTLSVYRHRYTFVPMSPFNHVVSVKYNNEDIPGSPVIIRVVNPAGQMALCPIAGTSKLVLVGQLVSAIITTQGATINQDDLFIKITAPNREVLPWRISQQPDSNLKIEYSARVPGFHNIEVQYAGQVLQGSPLVTEFFDPTRVLIEGTRTAVIGEPAILDVHTTGAGNGELLVTIRDSRNELVPFEIKPTASGYQIKYTPASTGTCLIDVSFGDVQVPGCPIRQDIEDCFTPTATGDGLKNATESKSASFTVNTDGRTGDLVVHIEGPKTAAQSNITKDSNGNYLVAYTPTDVGIYSILIRWNDKLIADCPFRAKVCNPDKLTVAGGWQQFLLNGNKMELELNQRKRVEFDSSLAGPGELRVEVAGPTGNVPVDIMSRDYYVHAASFMISSEGDYVMNVYWCQQLLQRCPIVGTAVDPKKFYDPQAVSLIGDGLTSARVLEESEFIVDGSRAGPGQPVIKLMGLKCDIDVTASLVSPCCYKCVYVPQLPGAYLLSVAWGANQVPGSPFKVTVVSGSDATKVSVTGAGLSGGICGQDLLFSVDIKRAGSGELSATCAGVSKPAMCRLEDQQNGTFLLRVTPQEVGNHQLRVAFNGDPVPGSPFNMHVQSGVDASKVRVSGPGIQPGILATFQSTMLVETRGAGPGRLTVRVRGPKGAFRVEMAKDPSRDRAIICTYNPSEIGQYVLHIKWADCHVPGSPFAVTIVDTMRELELLRSRPPLAPLGNTLNEFGGRMSGGTSIISGFSGGRSFSDTMSAVGAGDGLAFDDD